MSSAICIKNSVNYSSITSLITDYLGSKNKEIEEAICTHVTQESLPQVKEVDTLILRIFQEQVKMIHRGFRYSIHRYCIQTEGGKTLIDNKFCRFRGGITVSAKTMEIYIHFQEHCSTKIDLSPLIKQRLLTYILDGLPEPKFCCFDFSRYLTGKYILRSISRPKPFNIYWKLKQYPGESRLNPGKFVALCAEKYPTHKNKFKHKHHALYLGQGLHISVHGGGGDLVVMGLQQMAEYWKAYNVFLLTPAPISSPPSKINIERM
jgi:hypothetical protein